MTTLRSQTVSVPIGASKPEQIAQNVQSGMTVVIGETESRISGVGTDENGSLFAVAPTTLADGSYPVKVVFRRTQVLSLLFN